MRNKLNPVNWFDIPVHDLNKAKEFYEYVLGVPLSLNEMGPLKMAWFPMEQGVPGTTGSLVQAEGYTPSYAGSVIYFSVDDIEGTLTRVNEKGGKTPNPKMSIGEYSFVAHFEDCEDNRVALHSEK